MREFTNAEIKLKKKTLRQVAILVDLADMKTITARSTDFKIDVIIAHFDSRAKNKAMAKLIMEYAIDEIINRDVLIIAQDFLTVKERAKGIPSVKVVGPIVPDFPVIDKWPKHARKALVNLGGFTSPFNHEEQAVCYVDIVLPTLRTIVDSFESVSIMGGKTMLSFLHGLDDKLHAEIDLVSHGDAIAKISEASCYFTTPGLGSIYESFFSRTPTFFLPPTNLTQHLQLSHIVDVLGYSWRPNFSLDDLIDDEENYIASLYKYYDSKAQELSLSLTVSIEEFITSPVSRKKSVVNSGYEFTKAMGGASEDQVRSFITMYIYG